MFRTQQLVTSQSLRLPSLTESCANVLKRCGGFSVLVAAESDDHIALYRSSAETNLVFAICQSKKHIDILD